MTLAMPEAGPALSAGDPVLQTVMGFDFGSQKMGLAVGHSLTGTASPLPLLTMRDGIPDWPALLQLIDQWQPDLCVVGLPLNMDDSESELSMRARRFARRLRHHSQRAVVMVDERLTTREARQRQQLIRQQRRGRLPSADSLAAVALVEGWLAEPQPIQP